MTKDEMAKASRRITLEKTALLRAAVARRRTPMDKDEIEDIVERAHTETLQRASNGIGKYSIEEVARQAVTMALTTLSAENEKLRAALSEAVEWDSYDEQGFPAAWLENARQALAGDTDNG